MLSNDKPAVIVLLAASYSVREHIEKYINNRQTVSPRRNMLGCFCVVKCNDVQCYLLQIITQEHSLLDVFFAEEITSCP